MKIAFYILGGLVVLVLLLAVAGLLLPRRYRVERSAVIKAQPTVVYAQVADLKAWKNWGVWVDAGDLGLNPLSHWFGLFLDRMIGPDFEAGLAKLKALCENAP